MFQPSLLRKENLGCYADIKRSGGSYESSIYYQSGEARPVHRRLVLGGLNDPHQLRVSEELALYQCGSLTKPLVTCAFYLSTPEEDTPEDRLERPAYQYLNDPRFPSRIKLRDLIFHTSGIRNHSDVILGPDGTVLLQPDQLGQFYDLIRRHRTPSDDNDQSKVREYRNENYVVLGQCIQKDTGKSVGTILRDSLFEDLQMKTAIYNQVDFEEATIVKPVPHIAMADSITPIDHPSFFDGSTVSPTMGISMTTEDMAKFSERLLQPTAAGPIFPSVKDFMLEGWKDHESHTPLGLSVSVLDFLLGRYLVDPFSERTRNAEQSNVSDGINIGISLPVLQAMRLIIRDGSVPGSTSFWGWIPKLNASFAVLCSSSGRLNTPAHLARLVLIELLSVQDPVLHRQLRSELELLASGTPIGPLAFRNHAIEETEIARQYLRIVENPTPIENPIDQRLLCGRYRSDLSHELHIDLVDGHLRAQIISGQFKTKRFRLLQVKSEGKEQGENTLVGCALPGSDGATLNNEFWSGVYNRFFMRFSVEKDGTVGTLTRLRGLNDFDPTYQKLAAS